MSWKASGYVKELRDGLTVTDKFVLLVLAEYHRTDEKLSWPSVATLADDCLMTERGVRQILARLVKNGFIMRSQTGNGRGNISGYKIVGLDIKKGELETVNGCAPFKETLHSHAVKGERNPAQPAYRNKEEPVLELEERVLSSPSVPTGDDFQLNGDSGRQRKKPSSDPRHTPFKKEIVEFWLHLNPEFLRYEWDGADAGQLGSLLKKWPTLTLDEFDGWLTNYSESKSIVKSKTPKEFLPVIHRYAQTPLDEFQKPAKERRGAYS